MDFLTILSLFYLSSIVASQQFTVPNATVVPFSPSGLRISIPHEKGMVWADIHVKINSKFNSPKDFGPINANIVKAHNGQWTYEDKTLNLKVGDTVYYWIHFVHNQMDYHLLDKEYNVTELFTNEQVPPIPGSGLSLVPQTSGPQDFIPPTGTVTAFTPKGIRIALPHTPGMVWVSFHVQFNKDWIGLEVGPLTKDYVKPHNGQWTFEDKNVELKIGDTVYYWVNIVYNGVDYNLVDQKFIVTELTSRDKAPKPSSGIANVSNKDKVCSTGSVTKIFNDAGEVAGNTCSNELIFDDNFDSISERKWTVHEHFGTAPDFEFVVYRNDKDNLMIDNGNLKIMPQHLAKNYGWSGEFIRRGNLTLQKCTLLQGSRNCQRQAQGSQIIPPISSGRLSSDKSFRFKYGRVEIRAKLPKGDWIYPILSLEPFNSKLPEDERISMKVASSLGNPSLKTAEGIEIGASVLRGGAIIQPKDRTVNTYFPNSNVTLSNYWSDLFHTYELIWKPDELTLKADGVTYASSSDTDQLSALNQPMFLNLAVAVGGHREFPNGAISNNYKKPWKNWATKALFEFFNAGNLWARVWPHESRAMYVDYVKVYAI